MRRRIFIALIASAPLAPLLSGCGGSVENATSGGDASIDGATASDASIDAPVDAPVDAGGDTAVAWPVRLPLFGCDDSYSIMVSVGGSQPLPLSLDTESSEIAVAATGCSTCTQAGVGSLYTPGPSATDFRDVATATNADGQSWTGELYRDALQPTGMPIPATLEVVAIQTESMFFHPRSCQGGQAANRSGIIGLGPQNPFQGLQEDYYLYELVGAGMPDVFALQLCETGGNLWLGGFDPAFMTAAPQYTAMRPAMVAWDDRYKVFVAGLSAGGTPLAIPSATYGEALIDTGESNFLVPTAAYTALLQVFNASAAFTQLFGDATTWFSARMCVRSAQTADSLNAALPSITLTLGSSSPIALNLGATQSYVKVEYAANGDQYFCPALGEYNDYRMSADWDIGDVVLRANITIFDRANQRMGFAPRVACR